MFFPFNQQAQTNFPHETNIWATFEPSWCALWFLRLEKLRSSIAWKSLGDKRHLWELQYAQNGCCCCFIATLKRLLGKFREWALDAAIHHLNLRFQNRQSRTMLRGCKQKSLNHTQKQGITNRKAKQARVASAEVSVAEAASRVGWIRGYQTPLRASV